MSIWHPCSQIRGKASAKKDYEQSRERESVTSFIFMKVRGGKEKKGEIKDKSLSLIETY